MQPSEMQDCIVAYVSGNSKQMLIFANISYNGVFFMFQQAPAKVNLDVNLSKQNRM